MENLDRMTNSKEQFIAESSLINEKIIIKKNSNIKAQVLSKIYNS